MWPGGGLANKILVFLGQVAAALSFWIANYYYPDEYLDNGFYTFLALAIIYLVFRLILEHSLAIRIRDQRTKYSVRKAISIIYILIFVGILTQIWVANSDALLLSYGIIGAGIAIALQDVFKNFVGGLTIFLTGTYRIGDRVEINSKHGDVIDIGLLYTTLLEIQGWVEGDQATGRLTVIPNGALLSGTVNNYTKDHSFIWDEITLPLTYDSDWKEAVEAFVTIAKAETEATAVNAEKQMHAIMEKYYFSKRAVEPASFIRLTDNWIEVSVRYITDFRERRAVKSRMNELFLKKIMESSGRIKIASESIVIANTPEDTASEGD